MHEKSGRYATLIVSFSHPKHPQQQPQKISTSTAIHSTTALILRPSAMVKCLVLLSFLINEITDVQSQALCYLKVCNWLFKRGSVSKAMVIAACLRQYDGKMAKGLLQVFCLLWFSLSAYCWVAWHANMVTGQCKHWQMWQPAEDLCVSGRPLIFLQVLIRGWIKGLSRLKDYSLREHCTIQAVFTNLHSFSQQSAEQRQLLLPLFRSRTQCPDTCKGKTIMELWTLTFDSGMFVSE